MLTGKQLDQIQQIEKELLDYLREKLREWIEQRTQGGDIKTLDINAMQLE
jgi:hypothetical protein